MRFAKKAIPDRGNLRRKGRVFIAAGMLHQSFGTGSVNIFLVRGRKISV